jgi:hypothetical protein
LAAKIRKELQLPFALSHVCRVDQTLSREEKRVVIELWRAKVPLKAIRDQVNMSESTLRRVLAFAKKNQGTLIAGHKPGSGRPFVFSKNIQKAMRRIYSMPTQPLPSC